MFFLTLSNIDIQFAERKLVWRSYTAVKALPTTKRGELIEKKDFIKVALDKDIESFVVNKSVEVLS